LAKGKKKGQVTLYAHRQRHYQKSGSTRRHGKGITKKRAAQLLGVKEKMRGERADDDDEGEERERDDEEEENN
jgi:hypothetical protein